MIWWSKYGRRRSTPNLVTPAGGEMVGVTRKSPYFILSLYPTSSYTWKWFQVETLEGIYIILSVFKLCWKRIWCFKWYATRLKNQWMIWHLIMKKLVLENPWKYTTITIASKVEWNKISNFKGVKYHTDTLNLHNQLTHDNSWFV